MTPSPSSVKRGIQAAPDPAGPVAVYPTSCEGGRQGAKRGSRAPKSAFADERGAAVATLEGPVWLSQPGVGSLRCGRAPRWAGSSCHLPPPEPVSSASPGPTHPRRSCRPRRPQRSRCRAAPAPSWQQRRQGSDRWDLREHRDHRPPRSLLARPAVPPD